MKEFKYQDVAKLRNGHTAWIEGYGPTSKNVLIGLYPNEPNNPFSTVTRMCWHSSGMWRWDDKASSLDIVSVWKCPIKDPSCIKNCGNYGCGN
jgi:hypothetical protein